MLLGTCCQASSELSLSSIDYKEEYNFTYILQGTAIPVNTATSCGLCNCQFLALLSTSEGLSY